VDCGLVVCVVQGLWRFDRWVLMSFPVGGAGRSHVCGMQRYGTAFIFLIYTVYSASLGVLFVSRLPPTVGSCKRGASQAQTMRKRSI
jgi:hypothetical protein